MALRKNFLILFSAVLPSVIASPLYLSSPIQVQNETDSQQPPVETSSPVLTPDTTRVTSPFWGLGPVSLPGDIGVPKPLFSPAPAPVIPAVPIVPPSSWTTSAVFPSTVVSIATTTSVLSGETPAVSICTAIQGPLTNTTAPVSLSTSREVTSTLTPSTTSAPAASTTSTSTSDEGGYFAGTQTGQGTFFNTGLGACGITNNDGEHIAAVSQLLFDIYPGYTGTNPNTNPICGKTVTAHYQGRSTTVIITDRCVACAITDLDFSPAAFNDLADPAQGRIDITWEWV
ncbi:hypothetical protein ID866_6831 [Astraeus odoratus]|nr:hypothetical protein ID866_6831 [Astraeus odoratus]